MEKKLFCKRVMLWTAIFAVVIIAICGLCFGKVVEANLFEEVAKWIVMTLVIIGILEVFAYILAPFFWHWIYDKKDKEIEK
jgi:undecaprenyl pyrophosphate phosphatase UppP